MKEWSNPLTSGLNNEGSERAYNFRCCPKGTDVGDPKGKKPLAKCKTLQIKRFLPVHPFSLLFLHSSWSVSVRPLRLCSLDRPSKSSISNNRNTKINISHNTKMKAKISYNIPNGGWAHIHAYSRYYWTCCGLCGGRFSDITYQWQASSWGHSSPSRVRVTWHATHDCKKTLDHTLV